MKTIFFLLSTLCSLFLGVAQQSYYDDVDLTKTGNELRLELAAKITRTHTNLLTYTPGIWEASKVTDLNPENSDEVILIYGFEDGTDTDVTNDLTRGKDNNGGNNGQWNREHSYPRALGNPNLGSEGPGADAHHLRPSDVERNADRGSRKFGAGSGNSGTNVSDGTWYPGDEWKGDVARMMMYMYLHYGDRCLPKNVAEGTVNTSDENMIDLLLEWNAEDPVSLLEDNRNTYHDSDAAYAQGNRNPFIDNPYLATVIWGGTPAENRWDSGTMDTENPTTPTDLTETAVTSSSVSLSWTASTDNVAVLNYEIYFDDVLVATVVPNLATVEDLQPSETFEVSVVAVDRSGNKSEASDSILVTTLEADTEAPSVPENLVVSNETFNSLTLTWEPSIDNIAVTGYEVYANDVLFGTTEETALVITDLLPETTYSLSVSAKDAADNISERDNAVEGTTTENTNSSEPDLFFSEYVEGSSYNKALEIANFTGDDIDLSDYSVERQANGAGDWQGNLQLSGTLETGEVFVIINNRAVLEDLINEADLQASNAAPMNFNGNDAVGLFKNGELIDIIGTFNNGDDFGKDVTLRRKSTINKPSIIFNLEAEWDSFQQNTVDNIGTHEVTTLDVGGIISKKTFLLFPNPSKGNITLNLSKISLDSLEIYDVFGRQVWKSNELPSTILQIKNLPKGLLLVKATQKDQIFQQKIIVE